MFSVFSRGQPEILECGSPIQRNLAGRKSESFCVKGCAKLPPWLYVNNQYLRNPSGYADSSPGRSLTREYVASIVHGGIQIRHQKNLQSSLYGAIFTKGEQSSNFEFLEIVRRGWLGCQVDRLDQDPRARIHVHPMLTSVPLFSQ